MIAIPESLRLPTGLLGLLFLVCGAWALWHRPGRWTMIFLAYSLGGAIHWGGSIGSSGAGVERTLLLVYIACSALSEAALLHLALVYPGDRRLPVGVRAALYLPTAAALVLAAVASRVPRPVLESGLGLILLVAELFSLLAALAFVWHLVRSDAASRRAARLPLIVSALVLGGGSSLAAEAGLLPGSADAWNLAMGLVPLGLAAALATETVPRRP